MSFFSKLFTRKLTYVDTVCLDASYKDIVHVFGAIRVMPEDGDSFDIWRHAVIDLNTYEVTNGLQQTGNEFSVKSPFAIRAIEHMSQLMGRRLALGKKKEEVEEEYEEELEEEYDTEDSEISEEDLQGMFDSSNDDSYSEGPDLEDNCEVEIRDQSTNDTDTADPPKKLKNGLIFTENNIGDRERFLLQVIKSGVALGEIQLKGDPDYFRHVLLLQERNLLLVTYRRTAFSTIGGMGFVVVNYGTGEKVFDGYLK